MVEIAEQDNGLFDSDEYRVPFPQADGREVTDFVLRVGGVLKLNRNDPEQAAFLESLELGQVRGLNVIVSVDAKGQSFRQDALEQEIVTHTVALRVHEVTLPH